MGRGRAVFRHLWGRCTTSNGGGGDGYTKEVQCSIQENSCDRVGEERGCIVCGACQIHFSRPCE